MAQKKNTVKVSFLSISDLKINGKHLQNKIYLMHTELSRTHQCGVVLVRLILWHLKEQTSELLKAAMGKETEVYSASELFTEGSCVPALTNLRKSIHCF